MASSSQQPPRGEADVLRALHASEAIFERLADRDGTELHVQQELRKEFSDDVVRGALTLLELRARARGKFSRSDAMWFTRKGLEQSSGEVVASHVARRFRGLVWDWCCGIGGNAIALAEHSRVIAVDRSEAACLCARWNAEVYGVCERVQVLCGDVMEISDRSGLLHVDPDQRTATGVRSRRMEHLTPPLEFLVRVCGEFRGGAIKLSPASNFAGKFPDVEYELVSLNGECKQAVVWFGELKSEVPWRATVLPAGATLAGDPLEYRAELDALGSYLYDPDPAIVRAGMVDMLGETTTLRRLDESEEYLTSEELVSTPFARAFAVLAELPNNDREIRRYFREHAFGSVEIKCRHVPVQAEVVRRKLTLSGGDAAALIFARIGGKTRAVVARRVQPAEQ